MKNYFGKYKFIVWGIIALFAFIYNSTIGLAFVCLSLLYIIYNKRVFYYYFKGNAQYNSGNIETSFKYFEKAMKVKGVTPKIKNTYGYYLLRNRELEKSEQVLKDINLAAAAPVDKNQTRLNLALLYWKQDKLEEALKLLETVYREFKCTAMYESYGYLLIISKDYEKALEINTEARDYDSSNKIILDNLGETYYNLKDYDKANDIYTALMDMSPGFPDPYYHYALVLKEKGEKEKALEFLEKALGYKESYLSGVSHSKINSTIEEIKQNN